MTIGSKTISLFRLIALGLLLLSFIMLFLPWISANALGQSFHANVFGVGGGSMAGASFWTVMLVIFAILFLFALALAALGIWTERKLWALPVAGLALLMFLFDLFAVLSAKSELKSAMGGYESYHLHDYGFFDNNLKQTVADRIKAFLEKR